SPADGPLVEQSGREFPPAVSTTRAGNEPVSEDEDTPKILLGSRLGPQSLQSGTPPRQSPGISGETLRRPGGVAGSHDLNPVGFGLTAPKWRRVAVGLTAPALKIKLDKVTD